MTDITDPIARVAGLACWSGVVAPEPLTGGITNKNYVVRDRGQRFVVRIGDDIPVHQVMRFNELAASLAAAAVGLSPPVIHHEPGVLVLRFVEGKTLAAEDVRQRPMLRRILPLLRRCHREMPRHLRGPALIFWVFHVLRDYAATASRGEEPLDPASCRGCSTSAASSEAGRRPDRGRLRPQRSAAGQFHRRRQAPLADRLGLCRLQHAALRPRQSLPPTTRSRPRTRTGCSKPISSARSMPISGGAIAP